MTDAPTTPPASSPAPSPSLGRVKHLIGAFKARSIGFGACSQSHDARMASLMNETESELIAEITALASSPSTAEGTLFSDDEFPECVAEAEKFGGLGPNYFVGRKIAERFMTQFQDEHFKPLVDTFVEQFRDRMWDSVRDHLLSDTESNIQGEIWSGIDRVVEALLTGKEWALRQYVTEKKYADGESIRAAVAKLIPVELQDVRLADLQAENDKLTQENKRLRERY